MQEFYEFVGDKSFQREPLMIRLPLLRQVVMAKRIAQNRHLTNELIDTARSHEVPKDGNFYLLFARQVNYFGAQALKWDNDRPSVLLMWIGAMMDRYREIHYWVGEDEVCLRQGIDLRYDRSTLRTSLVNIDKEVKASHPTQLKLLIQDLSNFTQLDDGDPLDIELAGTVGKLRQLFRAEASQIPAAAAYSWPMVRHVD